MLTISQLADYVGVTVRAVRHYHQRGLLAEPERDASGYRRYGAKAVVDLVRIKTLADAGVPLARIEQLLAAGPEEFGVAVAELDRALAQKMKELKQHRRKIAELVAGERLFLPAGVADYLEDMRAVGLSDRTVELERDGWIMLLISYPDQALEWLAQKRAGLADEEFQKLYLAFDRALDWDPDDPRLADLVEEIIAYFVRERPDDDLPLLSDLVDQSPNLSTVLEAHMVNYSPSWERLNVLILQRMEELRRAGQA
ncbi:MAG TPA: MerR family transcriptional regulator [Actinocrinis sp.]|nr:MerR family transcriptional regulator [Actinocrinis sp.]